MDSQIQPAGNNVGHNTPADTAPPPAVSENPIAAPSSFTYLDAQLNKMDRNLSDEPEEEPAGNTASPISTITRATGKVIRRMVVPGVASVGAASLGYVLLVGRTMYTALAMLMGLGGLGTQKLDPATLLDYWEREGSKRDDHEKKLEGLFG